MKIVLKHDDGSELPIFEGGEAESFMIAWARFSFDRMPAPVQDLARAHSCDDPGCLIRQVIDGRPARCEGERSDGRRCELRAGHAGSHLVMP